IVVGGIVGGAFTATEGAAIAALYSLAIGFFVTKTLRLRDLPGCLFRASVTSGMFGVLISFPGAVTFVFTIEMVPAQLSDYIQSLTDSSMVFLLLVMLLLIVLGMFLESNAAYIMLVPLFAPLALAYGIDPLYFGFLFVLNLIIGMMTPPVGVLYFVVSGISKVPLGPLIKASFPFVLIQFGVLGLCIIFPDLVTALPRAMGF